MSVQPTHTADHLMLTHGRIAFSQSINHTHTAEKGGGGCTSRYFLGPQPKNTSKPPIKEMEHMVEEALQSYTYKEGNC